MRRGLRKPREHPSVENGRRLRRGCDRWQRRAHASAVKVAESLLPHRGSGAVSMSRASSETRRPCPPPSFAARARQRPSGSTPTSCTAFHYRPSEISTVRLATNDRVLVRNSSFERGVSRPVETRQTAPDVKEKAVIALMLSVCSIVEGAACRELQPIPLQPNTTMMGCLWRRRCQPSGNLAQT
jgi:hypothetical protein